MIDWISPLPENISSYGPDLDFMFKLIYYVTGAFFVGLEGYLVFLVFRYGILSKGKGAYEPGTRNQILWILILGAVVLVLDLLIDFKGAPAWAHVKERIPATDLTVKVQAKQFDWTFIYPGKDGQLDTEDDISSYRDFHVPVDKKVKVILTSKDVLHSFFMPEARFKQDVLPGREIPGWFDTNKTGTYDLLCSELCGFGHTRMNGVLKVHEEKEFEAALAQLNEEQHGGGE